jgi:release factor glutamine methyltransferase
MVSELENKIKRRVNHEPLAYIRSKSEFFGREFTVSADTLEPRPESETIIELLKSLKLHGSIIDVGTGSGCLAITTKLEIPELEVMATDISATALKIAQKNALKHDTDIKFFLGDLLTPIPVSLKPTVIMANLPYVPNSHTINSAAMFEPKLAIFGGPDGLDLYRQLFFQIANNVQFEGVKFVLTESLPPQHNELAKIALSAGFKLKKTDDFIQVFTS